MVYEKMQVVFYGAGRRCRQLLKLAANTDIDVIGIYDRDSRKWGEVIDGHIILESESLENVGQDTIICICIVNQVANKEVKYSLIKQFGFNPDCILDSFESEKLLIKNIKTIKQLIQRKTKYINQVKGIRKKIIFESRFGFGLGGIESWTKRITTGLIEINHEGIMVLARDSKNDTDKNNIIVVVNEDDQVVFYEKLSSFYLDNLPCILVSSQPMEELMAACIVKDVFPDMIDIVSVIHGGLDSIISSYLKYDGAISSYVAVSEMIRDKLMSKGVSSYRVKVKPCCIEIGVTSYFKRTYSLNRKEPIRIGYAGRLEKEQKRVDYLLKLIDELDNRNINFIFSIAGDGSYKERMMNQVYGKGLNNRVVFLGTIPSDEMAFFWMRQDIAVNLSDYEGHSISQMEAMSAGVVPILTNTSGVEDDVANGENGYIVPIGDYMTVAEKIMEISSSRELLPVMGRKARLAILKYGDTKENIEYWDKLLYSLELR